MKPISVAAGGLGRRLSPLAGALAITLWSGIAASSSVSQSMVAQALRDAGTTAASQNGIGVGDEPKSTKRDTGGGAKPNLLAAPSSLERTRHTVVLKDAPLASYDGSVNGFPTLPRTESGAHQGRVDVASSAARAYLGLLEQRQNAFLSAASTQVGRALSADATLRHAVNAVILDLSDAEAEQLRQRDDVMFVEREKQLELLTDRGPAFIGAPSIWDGTATGGVSTKGEGIVAAVLDSGINWQSPAFAATGPIDGYVHINPRGAGNYLGLCGPNPPNADLGRCNDKLIGMYNFTSTSATRSATDDDGHGSHTASTTAGNAWDAPFGGGTFRISGVAPHANIIAFKVCVGTCPSSAITQAANQAVADGIVDVMNFSISGGSSPWTDANSVAFLGAHNAGIFIAASAGNSGPAAGTSDHQEPWVQTVAASTHDRVLGFNLDATGPGTPPANTQNIPLRPGAQPIQAVDFYNVPLVKSPGFADGTTDGCTAFPAGTFTRPYAPPADRIFFDGYDPASTPPPVGAIAVLNLNQNNSGCGSGARQTAAVNAGAIGVIFVDPFYINLGAAGNAWSMLRSNWDNLAALDPATLTASLTRPARTYPGTGDVVADFSARGPRALANNQWLVKPDIAAPGVDILAAYQANVTATPNPNETGLVNGTSMASPHMAGAAVLMRALRPTWTPTQIKSALMLTAKTSGLVKQSGQPSDLWDRGAGRVDLTVAAKAGLILDETGANFLAANPATGGNVANLNLPSLATASCVGTCTFTRTVRRALTGAQTYTVTTTGFPGSAVAVTPASFTIGSSGTRALTITVQSQLLPEAAWALGEIVLTPSNPAEPPLHMPVAIRPGGPTIATTPTALSANTDLTSVQTLTINNTGNPTLNWAVTTTGTAQVTPLNTATTGNGQQGGFYNGNSRGYYWAQNFDVTATTRVTTLRANGFVLPNTALTTANTPAVSFSIYADASGVPAGAPQGFGAAPLWTYSNTISAANGITTTSGNLQLNLTAAGVAPTPLDLPPGRYWLMVWPTINGLGNNTAGNPLWAWRVSSDPQIGAQPQLYAPWDDPANWQFDTDTKTMSAFVQGTVDCTQPSWVSYSNTGGALGFAGQATTDATFNAAGLAAGTYRATMCITSNATNAPTLPIPLTFVVPNGGLMPPTLTKSFAPTSVLAGAPSTLTLTLANTAGTPVTLTAALTDTFPTDLVVAPTPNAATTCPSGTVTATAGAGSASLSSGAQIPANGTCTVTVDVVSATPNAYVNTIAAGGLQTNAGNNAAAATATLTVTAPPACTTGSMVEVKATTGTTGPTGYTTLKGGFDAINAGTHTGVVDVTLCGDTTETASAVLNASGSGSASYTAATVKPAGGAARTVSGAIAAGSPLIDLAGASNVTIDGLNAGGNALTLSNTTASSTAGTSTIRFINGASNNAVRRATILGSSTGAVGAATGNVLFSTSTAAGGNSTNTITGNSIGPAGANLPTKGVMGLGSASPNANSSNVIDDNNVFDFFSPTAGGVGISVNSNNNLWTISNNRIYQTAARTFTATAQRYSGINLTASTGSFTVTGNRIGFANAAGTGTTTISGSTNTVRGIDAASTSTTVLTTISNNVVAGISQTTAATGTTTSTSFVGIMAGSTDGLIAMTGNTVGSLDGSATIVVETTAGNGPVTGLYNFSNLAANVSNNNVGSITVQGAGTTTGIRGILVNTSSTQLATIVGNTVANLNNTQVGGYAVYAITATLPPVLMTDNVVRNLSGNANPASVVMSGISVTASSSNQASTIARNTVHSLRDVVGGTGAAAGAIYAIDLTLGTQANIVERNLVHSISVDSTFTAYQLYGMILRGNGTQPSTATVRNNMIRLGFDAAGVAMTTPYAIIGIRDSLGTGVINSYYHNSIYIGGSNVISPGSNTYAINSDTVTTARNFQNNIFWNARSNVGTGGTAHVAIRLGGTAPNPPGTTSNYNVIRADGNDGVTGVYNAAIVPTLADWQTATGQDANSVDTNPQFIAPNGSAVTGDLHINPSVSTPIEGTGVLVPSVTDDFDGQTRSGLTPTDIGADAGNFMP